jgi:hypothetical protein
MSSSWKVDSHSAVQKIPQISWSSKVHYHVHNILPLDPIPVLNQLNPLHTWTADSFKIHINNTSSHLHLGLPSDSYPVGSPANTLHSFLILQEIPHLFWKLCSQELTIGPSPEPHESSTEPLILLH